MLRIEEKYFVTKSKLQAHNYQDSKEFINTVLLVLCFIQHCSDSAQKA